MVNGRGYSMNGGGRYPKRVPASVQRVGQGIDIRFVVVQVERRPCRGRDAQTAHERLGAVVPGPDADPHLVENLGQVVGMDIAVGE